MEKKYYFINGGEHKVAKNIAIKVAIKLCRKICRVLDKRLDDLFWEDEEDEN